MAEHCRIKESRFHVQLRNWHEDNAAIAGWKAHLILEATSGGPFHSTSRWERDVNVVPQPPVISADSDHHYLYLGMADLAALKVIGTYTAADIRVGNQDFRAWPMQGGKPAVFPLYAFAWNMPAGTTPLAFASNGTGNDVTTPLTVIFPKGSTGSRLRIARAGAHGQSRSSRPRSLPLLHPRK